ncbi:PPR repeat family [Teratosphaeria destructans]|uniref:PPR repeat family n=1 Tax=Teratosphaeria destructans TaxID=418781 RepID=A0A9W7W3T4_9PEZI|nr:PPR repeat family [Teratosphaeria destructans]
MWKFAARIVELRSVVQKDSGVRAWHDGLLHELVSLWNLALVTKFQRVSTTQSGVYQVRSGPPSSPMHWSFLPSDIVKLLSTQGLAGTTTRSFSDVIGLLVPHHHSSRNPKTMEHYDYPSTALVTLDELRLRARSMDGLTAELWQSYKPLMDLFADILKQYSVTSMPTALAEKLEGTTNSTFKAITERLGLQQDQSDKGQPTEKFAQTDVTRPSISEQGKGENLVTSDTAVDTRGPDSDMDNITVSASGETQEVHASDNGIAPDLDETPNVRPSLEATTMPGVDVPSNNIQDFGPHTAFVTNQLKWLGKAWQQQSIQQALRCKQEILAQARKPAGKDLPNKIFEHLMLTLLALRNPEDALGVWNFFVGELDRQPTVQTYTVMMRGAQYVRDVKAMETLWRKMRNAGITPDAHAWSTRIFGLIKSNNSVLAMKAMDQLSEEWVQANKSKHVGDVTKPNIVIMNAAISALATKSDHMIPRVLSWGRRFGLEPDLVTHNVLLNLSMRHGKPAEAISILKRMSQKGINPDSQTWTILLTAMFQGDQLHGLSHEQQSSTVMSFITSLESTSNVGIDQKGYALIFDRLLSRYGNITAANSVLQHMLLRDVQPTTHILTILMRFYFQRRPVPDFAAVEALWNQIMHPKSGFDVNLDSIFYDRMVEWYARLHNLIGSTQPMMRFLRRMLKEQRRPSWRAMECAVRAVAERKEWSHFEALVDEARGWVKDGDREIVVGNRSFGQRDFWRFVLSTGMFKDEGLSRTDELMRASDGTGPLERGMQGVVQ